MNDDAAPPAATAPTTGAPRADEPTAGEPPPAASAAAPAEPRPPLDQRAGSFFGGIRGWGVARPAEGRWVAGVCAGLARRFNVDPLLVRALAVALAIVSGVGLLLYGLAWLFLPQDDGRIHAEQALRGDVTAGFFGGVLFILLDLGPDLSFWGDNGMWHLGWGWGNPFGLLVVGAFVLAIWWFAAGRHQRAGTVPPAQGAPPAPGAPASFAVPGYAPSAAAPAPSAVQSPPRPDVTAPSHLLTRATVGVALLAAGAVALWDQYVADLPGGLLVLTLAAALTAVAVGVVVAGLRGRRAGGLAPIGVLLALALVVSPLVPDWRTAQAVGDHTFVVTSQDQAERGYSLGVGSLTVDLTEQAWRADASATDPLQVQAQVGLGELVIRVPDDVAVRVEAAVGAGQLPAGGGYQRSESGPGLERTLELGGGRALAVVDARVGAGQVRVVDELGVEVTS